jgi:hypothetical protein
VMGYLKHRRVDDLYYVIITGGMNYRGTGRTYLMLAIFTTATSGIALSVDWCYRSMLYSAGRASKKLTFGAISPVAYCYLKPIHPRYYSRAFPGKRRARARATLKRRALYRGASAVVDAGRTRAVLDRSRRRRNADANTNADADAGRGRREPGWR